MDTNQFDNEMTPPASPKSHTASYAILGLVLVLVLAGAAFMAGRLMNRQAIEGGPQTGPQIVQGGGPGLSQSGAGGGAGLSSSGPGGEPMEMQLNVKPAPELPQTDPDATGLFVKLEDNSLFIGTGKIMMGVTVEGGEAKSESSYDGPVLEVVTTNETKIYVETTQLDPSKPPEGEIQQTVAPSTLDEISTDASIIVWGRRTGDRLVADVILYSMPMIFRAPGPP